MQRIRVLVGVLVLGLGVSAGCSKQGQTRSASEEIADRARGGQRVVQADNAEQRRAELLRRIRAADPQQQLIERALLNERNELGLILTRRTNLDEVPKLMRAMLAQMDQSFPGQDHAITAYTPTNPPQPIGTARLDARTRDMTYTPASP